MLARHGCIATRLCRVAFLFKDPSRNIRLGSTSLGMTNSYAVQTCRHRAARRAVTARGGTRAGESGIASAWTRGHPHPPTPACKGEGTAQRARQVRTFTIIRRPISAAASRNRSPPEKAGAKILWNQRAQEGPHFFPVWCGLRRACLPLCGEGSAGQHARTHTMPRRCCAASAATRARHSPVAKCLELPR
jgi:hypothetical protein